RPKRTMPERAVGPRPAFWQRSCAAAEAGDARTGGGTAPRLLAAPLRSGRSERCQNGRCTPRAEADDQRNRRSRRLLVTTNTLDTAIAAPASIGLSSPAAATGIADT